MTKALYAGTFDPPTFGHLDLVERGARLFDHLVVAIAENSRKAPLLTTEERVTLIRANATGCANVEVVTFSGLVVDYARKHGIDVLLRGLRTVSDFEYEYQMALTNRALEPSIDTAFVMPSQEYAFLSSSLIKEVMSNGGDASRWLPDDVAVAVRGKLAG
jgi:pantetheine-phosphate adenylyltransferase